MKTNSSTITTCLMLATIGINTMVVSADNNLDENNELNLDIEVKEKIENDSEQIVDLSVDKNITNNTDINNHMESIATFSQEDKLNKVRDTFKKFYIYGPMSNPTINLSDKNSLIKTYSQANDLLKTTKDGKKTDRQKFLDAWNNLSSQQKSTKEMKEINTSYKNIISVSTAAKSVFKFHEDVKSNKDTLIKDASKAKKLNDKNNKTLGARGKAYDDYTSATKVEAKANSKRVGYINEKYLDTVYFLNVSKYIGDKNKDKALTELAKIKDSTLKSTAQKAIEENFLTKNQEEVVKRFKQFYLYGSQSNPTIDLTITSSLIKTYKQATGLLELTKADGSNADRQVFLNAYNKLSDSEKENSKMKEIKSDYDNMIKIVTAAQSVFKFYEDVKSNTEYFIKNPQKSDELNSKSNLELGARGRAYNDYITATKVETSKNSKRVAYLNEKYCDTLYFLSIPKYIESKDTAKALELVDKIKDTTLNKAATEAIYNNLDNEFVITPNSPTFKNNMMNRPSYNENTKHYYLIRTYLEELDARGGGSLTLKAGTYKITNTLYIPSNTTIILDGATLIKTDSTGSDSLKPSKSIFQLISPSNNSSGVKFGGYNGEKNIKIIGKNNASIDLKNISDSLAIIIGHNTDVEVSGITFKNMNGGHFIELDASKNVSIKNNTFKGSKAYGNLSKEAINLDTPDKLTEGWESSWTKYDKTPNLNVYIENNLFSDLDRAIGTHKYSEGKYHTNIYIRNNTIEKTRSDSIRIFNWKNAVIENNIIKDINSSKSNVRGILASGAINPTIKNNTFINMPRAMQFFPDKNSGAGSEYDITYNELSIENKNDFANNIVENAGENFVRINTEYDIFTSPEKIYFNY